MTLDAETLLKIQAENAENARIIGCGGWMWNSYMNAQADKIAKYEHIQAEALTPGELVQKLLSVVDNESEFVRILDEEFLFGGHRWETKHMSDKFLADCRGIILAAIRLNKRSESDSGGNNVEK